MIGVLKLGITN